jgi:membrane protein
MKEFPKGGLIGRTVHLVRHIQSLEIPLHAANAGFFILLSIFPALVLILSLLRYTGLQVSSLVEVLSSFIPAALMGQVEALVLSTYENSSGALVGISALTALWSASKGVYGLLTGLNTVYGVSEDRGWLYTRTLSVFYTFAFLLVLLLGLVLNLFGEYLLESARGTWWSLLSRAVNFRFVLLLLLQTALFAAMYTVLPNRSGRFRQSLPGALLASIGWLTFSDIYSIYVEHFSSYSNIYGSVYAVALSMLWLYFCISMFFYGGALNHWLMHREKK